METIILLPICHKNIPDTFFSASALQTPIEHNRKKFVANFTKVTIFS